MSTMAYLEMDLETVEIHIDVHTDEELARCRDALAAPAHRERIQDEVLTAIMRVVHDAVDRDVTVRVRQPVVPPTPLVAEITTVPF